MPAIQIAVTGSQGKTNTARMIGETLKTIGKTVVTDIDLDTVYNVPITALKIAPWTDFAVFELGIDHQKEMNLHLQIVKPKIAIVTGISSVHTDKEHLGSLENLIFEKRKLLEARFLSKPISSSTYELWETRVEQAAPGETATPPKSSLICNSCAFCPGK